MRVRFFLFLLLLTTICRGQLTPLNYKKDSLATSFNVIIAILAEEELAHSIYYIDAYSGDFLYKNMEPEKIFLAEQGIYPKKR